VYAASSSCYGIPDVYPTPETAEIRPEYPYAFTKYLGEQYVLHYHQVYKIPTVSLRLFNVYGPRIRTYGTYGPVFSIFLAQKLKKHPYTVVGDGTQRRDFTFVSDVVNAFIAAAKSNICGQVFNVGSGGTYSVNQLVKLIGGPVIYIPKRPGEPDCTFADITKINKMLKWKPRVAFEDGVRLVINQIDYWKNAPIWTPKKIEKATKKWFKYLS
jgi:UDP-glucose 4-epimerase